MCYQGKCLICIPAKTGCLVLAILYTIGIGMVLLASAISGVLLAAGALYMNNAGITGDGGIMSYLFMFAGGAAGISILIVGITSLITFIFCVLLCNGICKRRPGQVMIYFIFGVTVTVLWLLKALVCAVILPGLGLIIMFFCAIHCLFLRLVHQTYFILLEEAAAKNHTSYGGTQAQRPCA